jgi:hypothetical protein
VTRIIRLLVDGDTVRAAHPTVPLETAYRPLEPDRETLLAMAVIAARAHRRRGDVAAAARLSMSPVGLSLDESDDEDEDGRIIRLLVDGVPALYLPAFRVRDAVVRNRLRLRDRRN